MNEEVAPDTAGLLVPRPCWTPGPQTPVPQPPTVSLPAVARDLEWARSRIFLMLMN